MQEKETTVEVGLWGSTEQKKHLSRREHILRQNRRKGGQPKLSFCKTYGKIPDFCGTFLQTPPTRENRDRAFFAKISSFATFSTGKQA